VRDGGESLEGVKQYKDLTLTHEGTAGGTFLIKTDMPGGVLSTRRTITLPATAAGQRVTRTYPLDSAALHGGDGKLLEGKLIVYRAESTGALILYEGFVRFRRVGVYVDGASGDVWETQPLSLG